LRLRIEAGRPPFDGLYLRWRHLSGPPELAQPASYHLEGRLRRRETTFEVNPSVWRLLGDRRVAVRGRAPRELGVWTDREALASWTLENLNGYWAGLVERAHRALPVATESGWLDAELPVWRVLGAARLHYTLVTGEIISKSGAGAYALARFPYRWGPIVRECLRIRREAAGRRSWLTTA
jgi:hypothetical protein